MKQNLGQILLESGQITAEDLQEATEQAAITGESIGKACLRLGLVNATNLKTVLELQYGLNYVNLSELTPDQELIGLLPQELILQQQLIPISKEGNRLTLAMVTPSDRESLERARKHLADWQIRTVVCSEDGFEDFTQKTIFATGNPEQSPVEQMSKPEFSDESVDLSVEDGLEKTVGEDRAIVLLSNHILSNAISRGCTNIHIEPGERQILVHYRKEGVLFAARKLPKSILPNLVSRFKGMAAASADVTLPYDGRLNVHHGGENFFFPSFDRTG